MFIDSVTGEQREIDVALETNVGRHSVIVAIETRDQRRPADVTWIDELVGKYLNTSFKVVAVSRSGFTKAAKIKAEKSGIDAITLEEASRSDWPGVLSNQKISVASAVVSKLQARFIVSDQYASSWIAKAKPSEYADAELDDGSGLYPRAIEEVITELSDGVDFAGMALEGLVDSDGMVVVSFELPDGTTITKPGEPDVPASRLDIRMRAEVVTAKNIELIGSMFNGQFVAHGTTVSNNYELQVVATGNSPTESVFTFSVFDKRNEKTAQPASQRNQGVSGRDQNPGSSQAFYVKPTRPKSKRDSSRRSSKR